MARQCMPNIFHDPHKNPPGPLLHTYLMYGPLKPIIFTRKIEYCI